YEAGRPAEPQMAQFHDFLTKHYGDEWNLLTNDAGIDLGKVENYIPRRLKQLPGEMQAATGAKSPLSTFRPGRTELYRDVPQAKTEAMLNDPAIQAMTEPQ